MSAESPSRLMSSIRDALRRNRNTALSPPSCNGNAETRISTSSPPIRSSIFPSWGRLRSAISIAASIFSRVMTGATMAAGMLSISWSTPSMRKRTRARPACGSMCMSDAPRRRALAINELSRLTVGASDASSRSRSSSTSDRPSSCNSLFSRPTRARSTSKSSAESSCKTGRDACSASQALTSRSNGEQLANSQPSA